MSSTSNDQLTIQSLQAQLGVMIDAQRNLAAGQEALASQLAAINQLLGGQQSQGHPSNKRKATNQSYSYPPPYPYPYSSYQPPGVYTERPTFLGITDPSPIYIFLTTIDATILRATNKQIAGDVKRYRAWKIGLARS